MGIFDCLGGASRQKQDSLVGSSFWFKIVFSLVNREALLDSHSISFHTREMKKLVVFAALAVVCTFSWAFAKADAKSGVLLDRSLAVHGGVVFQNLKGVDYIYGRWDERGTYDETTIREDFVNDIWFRERFVSSTGRRGVVNQQRVERGKGQSWNHRDADNQATEISPMSPDQLSRNLNGRAGGFLSLRKGSRLDSAKYLGEKEFFGKKYDHLEIVFGKGRTNVLLDKSGRYAGSVFGENGFQLCSVYKKIAGVLVPVFCQNYDKDSEVSVSQRITSFKINPKFSAKNFSLKIIKMGMGSGSNPFGMVLAPADVSQMIGARVIPSPLLNPALSAGLDYGDQIISVNGKSVSSVPFGTVERIFWDLKLKKVVLKVLKKSGKQATYTVVRK